MTPEQTDLARRLVAREEWRWMPGMLASDGHRLDDVDCDGLHPEAYGVMPDLNDPSTCGCLLESAADELERFTGVDSMAERVH